MASGIKSGSDLILNKEMEGPPAIVKPQPTSNIDPQLKIRKKYAPRRSFDTGYKLRILSAYDACETPSQRGALLRKEGLYLSRICAWKQQLENSKLNNKQKLRGELRVDHLVKENETLKKKLAQAEAVIEIQKKISELLGIHTLTPTKNE